MQVTMRFIRNLLYKLKRQYGASIVLYQTTAKTLDSKTGVRELTQYKLAIQLAIVLPDTLANKFAYEHSFLYSNKQFTYGAQWDQRQRLIVIDGQDLPRGVAIGIEDYIVFNNERYKVVKADQFDNLYGYLLTVVRAENNLPLQVTDISVSQVLRLGQSAGTS